MTKRTYETEVAIEGKRIIVQSRGAHCYAVVDGLMVTPDELDALRLMGEGKTAEEVGEELGKSKRSIQSRINDMRRRNGKSDSPMTTSGYAAIAQQAGLLNEGGSDAVRNACRSLQIGRRR